MLYLALTIVLLSCADALFTLNLLQLGATEANVLMHTLITHDVDRFIAVKIGATCVGVIFLGLAARRHILGVVPVIRVLQAFCLGYGLLIAYELGLFLLFFGESPLAHAADVLPGWLQ